MAGAPGAVHQFTAKDPDTAVAAALLGAAQQPFEAARRIARQHGGGCEASLAQVIVLAVTLFTHMDE